MVAGIKFSAFSVLCQIENLYSMNSAPLLKLEDITVKPLAPVIAIKSVTKENDKLKRKVSTVKLEKGLPLFYNRPIYKTKKFDLL